MKLKTLIERIKAAKPDSLGAAELTAFVNEVEGFIHTEIHQLSLSDYKELDYASDSDVELSVAPPHDKLYFWYLWAMIDFAHGEYNNYSNAITKYNNDLAEYSRYVARVVRPAAGQAEKMGYYLSAYAIAVKHGFAGSEEEWVARLNAEVDQARKYADLAFESADAARAEAELAEKKRSAAAEQASEAENFASSAKASAEASALSAERAATSVENARAAVSEAREAVSEAREASAATVEAAAKAAETVAREAAAEAASELSNDVKQAENDIKQMSDFMRNTNLIDLKFHQGGSDNEIVSERIKFNSPVSSSVYDFGCELGVIMYDADGNQVGSSGLWSRVQEASLVKGATYIELWIYDMQGAHIDVEDFASQFRYWDNIPYDSEVNKRVEQHEERLEIMETVVLEHETKITELETQIGDIDTALDAIIAIQNELIGGEDE